MSRAPASRDAWHPQSREDCDGVLREMHKILASPQFSNSKRYPALLQYIIENTLAGRSELLKERTLGVEVFDRSPTYDTNADTVVRYTAGEVRKRLQLYYSVHSRDSQVQISLPAGSYIPEFLQRHDESEDPGRSSLTTGVHLAHNPAELNGSLQEPGAKPDIVLPDSSVHGTSSSAASPQPLARAAGLRRRLAWLAVGGLAVLLAFAGLRWRSSLLHPQTAVDDFWGPVVHDQRTVLICTGGVVFQPNNFSGVVTASKDIEYPFVSMQIASAIAQISGLVERFGATTQVLPSPSTPLSELREHTVVLVGGYNNQWAMRLVQSQPFQFTPEPVESIVDRKHPEVHWSRDKSLPYSSADDYALVARFHDSTTGSWVVVLAGLGRNGTEAAAQFATSPHYMQMLQGRIGATLSSNKNIAVVLKVRVIDGKTGAPSVEAAQVW